MAAHPPDPPDPLALRFVVELLKTSAAVGAGVHDLLAAVAGRDPWPGEDPAEVLLDMAAGSVRPVLRAVPPAEVERAIELMVAVRERFIADLRLAAELERRRRGMRRPPPDE